MAPLGWLLGLAAVAGVAWFYWPKKKYVVAAIHEIPESRDVTSGEITPAHLAVFDRIESDELVAAGLAVNELARRYEQGNFVIVVTYEDHVVGAKHVSSGQVRPDVGELADVESQLRSLPELWNAVA
jgi:hypothetical protein